MDSGTEAQPRQRGNRLATNSFGSSVVAGPAMSETCQSPAQEPEVTIARRLLEANPLMVGLGFPRPMKTVGDSYQFLLGWWGNSPGQNAAKRDCKAALAGEVNADAAQWVFTASTRKKNILVEDGAMPPIGDKANSSHV